MKEKKYIRLPQFASSLMSTDSMKDPFQLAQYNLVGLPNTNQYNVCYVPLDNSKQHQMVMVILK